MQDFKNEKEMFRSLSDFIHYSKSVSTPLRHKLIKKITEFLSENELDTDPHEFVDSGKIETRTSIINRYDRIIAGLEKRIDEPFEGINPIAMQIAYYKEMKESFKTKPL